MKLEYIPKTELEKILMCNFNENWDWDYLSSNPNISMDFIEYYKDKPWNWYNMSFNSELTFEIVQKNLDKDLNWIGISSRPNISIHTIINNEQLPWVWMEISKHTSLTLSIIEKYPNKNWDWVNISNINNINIDFIKKFKNKNWCWRTISQNIRLSHLDIKKNFNYPWDWSHGFSNNKSLTCEFIEDFINQDWNWRNISKNPCIYNINFIKKHVDKDWDWEYLSLKIDEKEKTDNYLLPWVIKVNVNSPTYHKLPLLKLESIIKNDSIILNCIIFKYYASLNPNITLFFLEKYSYIEWKWDLISDNLFNYNNNKYSYPYSNYRNLMSKKKNQIIEKELLKITWQPKRIYDWCLDEYEKQDLL